jgi:hypothetical protein
MATAHPIAAHPAQHPQPDHPQREIERHVLRVIRRLDDSALTHLLGELRSLARKESRA